MHWVVERGGVLKYDSDGFVATEVVGIPLRIEGVGDIAFISEKK